jgi:hypothetical protein
MISFASLAMMVSAWCWQFALNGTQAPPLTAAIVSSTTVDDSAAVFTAPAGAQRLDTEAADTEIDDGDLDSPDGFVALVAPVADQLTPVIAPATASTADVDGVPPATTGPRAPPQRLV